jgi:hypothetical protein
MRCRIPHGEAVRNDGVGGCVSLIGGFEIQLRDSSFVENDVKYGFAGVKGDFPILKILLILRSYPKSSP